MISRRDLLTVTGGLLISPVLAKFTFAGDPIPINDTSIKGALDKTDLIYLTPLRSDGKESRCQSEVWFVADQSDVYVVTAADTWRARAAQQGLEKTRIWVGDVGVWTKSQEKYKELPSYQANSALMTDPADHERVLDIFGAKYSLEWIIWGSRFKKGLKDGSRVMLRYKPFV